MCASRTRLELQIDVFEKGSQKALVLPELTPSELVGAVLQEFRELEYLGDSPDDYRLLRADGDGSPLEDGVRLGEQLSEGERLVLVERDPAPPQGTVVTSQRVYLRELSAGKTHRIAWQPAIIGRTSQNQPLNEWVAVDLKQHPDGLRVSRRHVRLTESGGRYFVENLSNNPVSLSSSASAPERTGDRRSALIAVGATRQRIDPGDVITLDRSGISLKFVLREEMPAVGATAAPPEAAAEPAADVPAAAT